MTAIHPIQNRTNARGTPFMRGPATVLALWMALVALCLGGRAPLAKLPMSDPRGFMVIEENPGF